MSHTGDPRDLLSRQSGGEPLPLVREGGAQGQYLEAANRALEPGRVDEARAWASLMGGGRRRTRRTGFFALAAVGCVAALAMAALPWLRSRVATTVAGTQPQRGQPQRGEVQREAQKQMIVPLPPPPDRDVGVVGTEEGVALAPVGEDPGVTGAAPPAPLRPGRAVVAAGVRARLSSRGIARLFRATPGAAGAPGAARIALERGKLDIDSRGPALASSPPAAAVAQPAPVAGVAVSPRVAVSAASFVFQGDDSRYSVRVDKGNVDLVVHGGRVFVWSSRRLVARVLAGQRWNNLGASRATPPDLVPPLAEVAAGDGGGDPAAGRGASAGAGADCLPLARSGRVDEALACFEAQAARPGLTGELALVEIARIRRDVRGDLEGAERALAEHRRRFPSGALAAEAATSRVEVLLRLGRSSEALAEAGRLGGSEALYFRGLALAKLGRADEARRALDDYLGRPDATRRAEAARRRQELAP